MLQGLVTWDRQTKIWSPTKFSTDALIPNSCEGRELFKLTKLTPEGSYPNALETAWQGCDVVSRVCHTWGSWSTWKQLWDLSCTPRALEESRGMLQRWWRPLGPARCRHGMVLISVSPSRHADTTPAWFLMACTAAPWASSDGYVFKEAFILTPSLPVQVSSPYTEVDDDYEGEWCLLALPWERAWRDGSIVPGSPWLLAIPVLGELKRWVDLERRF